MTKSAFGRESRRQSKSSISVLRNFEGGKFQILYSSPSFSAIFRRTALGAWSLLSNAAPRPRMNPSLFTKAAAPARVLARAPVCRRPKLRDGHGNGEQVRTITFTTSRVGEGPFRRIRAVPLTKRVSALVSGSMATQLTRRRDSMRRRRPSPRETRTRFSASARAHRPVISRKPTTASQRSTTRTPIVTQRQRTRSPTSSPPTRYYRTPRRRSSTISSGPPVSIPAVPRADTRSAVAQATPLQDLAADRVASAQGSTSRTSSLPSLVGRATPSVVGAKGETLSSRRYSSGTTLKCKRASLSWRRPRERVKRSTSRPWYLAIRARGAA
jgi:hypothetical protein